MNPQPTDAATSPADFPIDMLPPLDMPLTKLRVDEDPFSHTNTNIQPREMDVLIGIPPAEAAQHPGNMVLQDTVDGFLEAYTRAKTKHEKMRINRCVMSTMRDQHGSRFLKRVKTSGLWRYCDESSIRDKVSNALRTGWQRKEKPNREKQQKSSHKTGEGKTRLEEDDEDWAKIQRELLVLHESQKRILHDRLGFDRRYS